MNYIEYLEKGRPVNRKTLTRYVTTKPEDEPEAEIEVYNPLKALKLILEKYGLLKKTDSENHQMDSNTDAVKKDSKTTDGGDMPSPGSYT